ncbi:MAG: penicillin acylase family protein [Alphaproteobacteria bacterium]|nr:penicillin acylase family protein [Alphaproteobacteria bacterium]
MRRLIGSLLTAIGLGACGILAPLPPPANLDQRLSALPTQGMPLRAPVTIRWDDHQIPFIEAEHDDDLAFAIGIVQAHLRLGLMEFLRHASQGRLAEIGGPLVADIDHALRIVDFGKAAPEIVRNMPEDTRRWLDHFVRGVNFYVAHSRELPHEYKVMGIEPAPWTAEDVITAGRLASADVNWFIWFSLLKQRKREDWPRLWAQLVAEGSASFPSYAADRSSRQALFQDLLGGFSRSGSNSVAVAGWRSASGSALLASDPHLGVSQPNLWIIIGYRSPSYHAVGLMPPALPFIALGRNPDVAWGGTNLRAASSDLFDLSGQNGDVFRERVEQIKVRWWFDRTEKIRETPHGPVISDAGLLDLGPGGPFALRWVGHDASDELTAMLGVSRARNWEQFRTALEPFAVSAQNMVYADRHGNIGLHLAARLPKRPASTPSDAVLPPDALRHWQNQVNGRVLPSSYNPPAGLLATGNNRGAESPVPVGYFFSPNDRVVRMGELLRDNQRVTLQDLAILQRDVREESSVLVRDAIVARVDPAWLSPDEQLIIEELRRWDGRYETDSKEAVTFMAFATVFASRFLTAEQLAAYEAAGRLGTLLAKDIAVAPAASLRQPMKEAAAAAKQRRGKFATWGDMHRLSLSHTLGMIPVLGRRFVFGDIPVAGSSQTINKTAHALTDRRHTTRYGSNARHISDLANPDENYFVLLGGQDGWMSSSTFLDQVPLWQRGEYVKVPLDPDRAPSFRHRTVLRP